MSGKISLALGAGALKKAAPPPPTNGVKRPRAALHDQDDDDADGLEHGKVQRVSQFDREAGGAIDDNKPRPEESRPLVIAPQANRDWREAGQAKQRRQKSGLPVSASRSGEAVEAQAQAEASQPDVGLTVRERRKSSESAAEESAPTPAVDAGAQTDAAEPERTRTDDERAIDALLGRDVQPDLVLPAVSEAEAFERDFRSAPEMASLDDYARVPVEQFGAALLRGMGWKDGEGIGSERGAKAIKTKVAERRPALLGIGAKEEAAVAQELGSWGRAAKDRKGPQVVYNPVLLRDKQTGELFTEEELQKKREQDERKRYELEFEEKERRKDKERRRREGSRDRDSDRREKSRRPEYKDDRNGHRDDGGRARDDRSRHRDRSDRHNGDRDSDLDRERRQRRDDDDDEYYRRKKEKERRQRDRERDEADYERPHSRQNDDRHRHSDERRDRR